jgi:hypothetical protein
VPVLHGLSAGTFIEATLDRRSGTAMMKLDVGQEAALAAKRSYRRGLVVDVDEEMMDRAARLESYAASYDDYGIGEFIGLDNIRLQWVRADYFAFIPRRVEPFAFRRPGHGNDVITPRHMFTDGGSVPRVFQSLPDLSPWTYGSAYLLHDWLFDLHHCGDDTRDFDAVRDILMEAIKTLMEVYPDRVPKSRIAFALIRAGVDSRIARQIWDKTGDCPIPPDVAE